MRTTVELDPDTAAAVERLRKEQGLGVSEAVNELLRRGLLPTKAAKRFRQQTFRMGAKIDVSNVAEALEILEGPTAR